MKKLLPFIAFILSACSPGQTPSKPDKLSHPFVGCWQSEDGLSNEVWSEDPSGWLFGYAVNRDDKNQVTFFEHMRIDAGGLVVIGAGDDPVRFKLVSSGPDWVFENPDHDFPQRISYTPAPGRLDAYISLMNGDNKIAFNKAACQ